jgi:molybdopterin synthase catalytic subunit
MTIRIQKQDFDAGREINMLCAGNSHVGGVCSFIGLVREDQLGGAVKAMTLEHYSGMTEKQLAKIEIEANNRWALEGSLIVHRYGRLVPSEQIVLVVTASAHRKAAFESCEFLIDWLKTKAPFWKNEETPDGKKWVQAKFSDDMAAGRWQK